MVVVIPSPSALDTEMVSLYFCKDPLIGGLPVIVFYGPSTTINSTQNSSRIQAHVFSIAGYKSFPRLTNSPTSHLYVAVQHLPQEKQGDEICRGLTMSLMKYFDEMPVMVKQCLQDLVAITARSEDAPSLFDEIHAATLAANMVEVENSAEIACHIQTALVDKKLSWTDLDVVLPPGSASRSGSRVSSPVVDGSLNEPNHVDYGVFQEITEMFGSAVFLPTSKVRRAPSRPTATSKTRVLGHNHKEALQRDMKELLQTEKSYVMKLYDLSQSPAAIYSRSFKRKHYPSITSDEQAIINLFPESLSEILKLNTEFLDAIRLLLGDVDEHVVSEMDNRMSCVTERDPTGVDAFARTMLQFIPRFREPYQAYLRESSRFSTTLSTLFEGNQLAFLEAIRRTGEQLLKSWLIEPVQRLPRYSLFIENMINQLPASHPATTKFLKCKDMLADICALDDEKDTKSTIGRLKKLVSDWPDSLIPEGRLISVVDAAELKAPFKTSPRTNEGGHSLILLFTDTIIVLRKLNTDALSARGLLAELDQQTSSTANLALLHSFPLDETRTVESGNGVLLSISCVSSATKSNRDLQSRGHFITTIRNYYLLGPYEGKASRWSDEVARARIEHRFPENMREDESWCLRVLSGEPEGIGMIAAIFEDDADAHGSRRRKANGRIQVHLQSNGLQQKCSCRIGSEVEIDSTVTMLGSGNYRIEFRGLNGFESIDNVGKNEFAATFSKRLGNLQRLQHQPLTMESAHSFVSYNQKIIETVRPHFALQRSQSRSRLRPYSPVKALSNFLGGSFREPSSPAKRDVYRSEDLVVETTHELQSSSPPTYPKSRPRTPDDAARSKVKVVDAPDVPALGSISQLEKTFNSYVVAMHSRCGNIVGKTLRARRGADELKVNELYNTLIEDPGKHQAAAEVSVDVLFAAFEKYLNYEWRDRMGPILPNSFLKRFQSVFDNTDSSQIPEQFNAILHEMTPQNRRAFSTAIRLLFDLLAASSNDGDRGALTAAFAEILVMEGNPHAYISLLDRLVDDVDALFNDAAPVEVVTGGLPSGSLPRGHAANTGSVSSNGSSLRKRFGLGILTRENSKSDSDSRVGQVWRSLSKKSSQERESHFSSITKGILSRSRSQDRPNSSHSASQQSMTGENVSPNLASRPLSTIIPDKNAPTLTPSHRRKRRSSLSDLKDVQGMSTPFKATTSSQKNNTSEKSIASLQSAKNMLRPNSPTKLQKLQEPSRVPSPSKKENTAPLTPGPEVRTFSTERDGNEVSITSLSPRKRNFAPNDGATVRNGLQERTNFSDQPTGSPQKMKIQSPQKIRERLEKEKRTREEITPALQAEIEALRAELSMLNTGHAASGAMKSLTSKLAVLEQKLTSTLDELTSRTTSIQKDLESSLAVSEKKCKSLDGLYRESNAENELLYERFNSELAKVLSKVKGGEGTNAMQAKLEETQNDAARLRKENQRLKREVLGLRSQLTGR